MAAVVRRRGRVLVVDDDPYVIELAAITLGEHGYVVHDATNARDARALLTQHDVDVAVVDVHLPDISGYQLCRDLRDDHGDSIGIMLISGERTESFDRAGGLLLGADDYLLKPFALDELLARVERLARQAHPVTRGVSAKLTKREVEVLRSLAAGLDHVDIARQLVVSAKTVEKHIEHILFKLGVHSRSQAIALALNDEASALSVGLETDVMRRGHLTAAN
jgi:DNA-binding NarL/FixJ family response regulator